MTWFFRLPLLVRIPLLSAIMIFLIAMLVTQMAIFSLSRQYNLQTERVGQVYLDGLSAAVEQAYKNRDIDAIHRALSQSLNFYLGVIDRQVALLDRDNDILAHVSGPHMTGPTPPPETLLDAPSGYAYDADSRSVWVWRQLGETGTIAANLDTSAFADERAALRLRILFIGILLSIISALVGYLVIRNMQRPLGIVSEQLSHAVAFGPQKIPDSDMPVHDNEARKLIHAYNRMAQAVEDRERLSERLAKQNQQAVLGHIAATLAHEMRNPLTGIMTALQTIRMYGDDPVSRNEALEFIDRGIQSLQGVAQATLNMYRPSGPGPDLQLRDLHDIVLLVEPHAAKKSVDVQSELNLGAPVNLDAFKIRQIALNLLLNAIQTSPFGGKVTFQCSLNDQTLILSVTDEGPGLPDHAQHFLLANESVSQDGALGLETVRRLTHELDGEIDVLSNTRAGSAITLTFKLAKETTS